MYIITVKDNEEQLNAILNWDMELDHLDNGYPKLVNKNIAFPSHMVNVYEYKDDIPDYVIPSKYCYTEEKGFYLNPNWVEPPASMEQKISELEDAIIELASLVG